MTDGGKRGVRIIAALILAGTVGSCSPSRFETQQQWILPPDSMRAISLEPAQYRLAVGDKVRTTVFGQTNVTGEYLVDESGAITLPLAGPIRVKGLTAPKAAKFLEEKLKALGAFRDPRVSVELSTFAPIYVLGEVNRPVEFAYRPGMSLFSAVALAGGFTFRAQQTRVFVRANDERIETDYKLKSHISVMPGDVIRIPEVTLFGGG
jgi:polysaccharide export outer membrane protein